MIAEHVVERNPEILGGAPVFARTRVPVQTLLDYLVAGQSLAEFLDDYPSVEHAQTVAVLEGLKRSLMAGPNESVA